MGIQQDMVDRVATIRNTFWLMEWERNYIEGMYRMTQTFGTDFDMSVKQINTIQRIWMDGNK